jgi:hypothetical protein
VIAYGGAMATTESIRMLRRVRRLRIGDRVDPVNARDLIRAIETATAERGGMFHARPA